MLSTETAAFLAAVAVVALLALAVLLALARADASHLRWMVGHLQRELASRGRAGEDGWPAPPDGAYYLMVGPWRRKAGALRAELDAARRELARLERDAEERGCRGVR